MNIRLRFLRHYLDLTQQEFAERIGIKRNTLANYEAGRNVPIDAVISLIVKEFQVNEKWLKYGEGEIFQTRKISLLELLSEDNTFNYYDEILIKKYLQLPRIKRDVILSFIKEVVLEFQEDEAKNKKKFKVSGDKTYKFEATIEKPLNCHKEKSGRTPEEYEKFFYQNEEFRMKCNKMLEEKVNEPQREKEKNDDNVRKTVQTITEEPHNIGHESIYKYKKIYKNKQISDNKDSSF